MSKETEIPSWIFRETEIRLSSVEEVLNEKNVALANAQVQIKSLQNDLRKQENMNEELQGLVSDEEEKRKCQAEKHQADLEKLKKVIHHNTSKEFVPVWFIFNMFTFMSTETQWGNRPNLRSAVVHGEWFSYWKGESVRIK